MQIRVAQPGDIPEIERLLRSVPGVWQAVWRDDVVERALSAAGRLAYVAAETDLIGFGCAHDFGFRAYLSELVVAESWQRRGVGSALLSALQCDVAARGCRLVVADVFPPAVPFYRAHGWDGPSAVLLRRRLGPPNTALR
ncbi:MAG TPA: GNAT family N-acetyltransferase [Thermoanaerobaculia bacterium]